MRIVVATCTVDYSGRLDAHLPAATRVIMVKSDGSVLVHADGGSYKPLNWMSPPCTLVSVEADDDAATVWEVRAAKSDDKLRITLHEVLSDTEYALGVDPGLVKDGVEAHLQKLLAEQVELLGAGHTLVRREYPTAIGPVDLLAKDPHGVTVAVEVKRRGEIDGTVHHKHDARKYEEGESPFSPGDVAPRARHVAVEVKRKAGIDAVEQLTRYLELLNRDPLLAPVRGVLAAQSITKQARTLAEDRGIECKLLDYDAMRGLDDPSSRLF